MNIREYLLRRSSQINEALQGYLPRDNSILSRAMRYSVNAGGKRLRPILVLEGALVCGGTIMDIMPAACAVEYVHTYSLIHDDLPAMDNDDFRRGMPTSHKKFGEATAILAGDALLTDAFSLLSQCAGHKCREENVIKAVRILSEAAGSGGMVGGQACDTVSSGAWKAKNRRTLRDHLFRIHHAKTAALIKASLLIGGVVAEGSEKQVSALSRYGNKIGFAFQIMDDILDITGDRKLLGKRGSDRDNDKLTFPALYGLKKSRKMADDLVKGAKDDLVLFGRRAGALSVLADYIIDRKY